MTRQDKLEYIASVYMKSMWQKAYGIISDTHEAEDVCQEAFIKIIRIIDEIDDVTEPKTRALCNIIAKNTAIDFARKNGRAAPTEDIYLDLESEPETKNTPEQNAESKEALKLIDEEIEKLNESYRDVIKLRCLYELSAERTAEILGCNANMVNIKLTRARKQLKERLKQRGFNLQD